MRHDVAVIGLGMIGAAVARYLSSWGVDVIGIGVSESNHHGVHGSHHDEARITRFSGPDRIWSHLAAESIAAYPGIEEASGIVFHRACGHLRCDLPSDRENSALEATIRVLEEMPVVASRLTAEQLRSQFPFLHFASDAVLHLEPDPAGIINPRKLVQAQLRVASVQGASIVDAKVTEIEREGGLFSIRTSKGLHRASEVVLATGAYTSLLPLTDVPFDLSVRPETVLLARIEPDRHGYLMDMPGVIWNFDHRDDVPYAYILPPVRYDDGHYWIKIGADHDRDIQADSVEGYHTYMQGFGSRQTAILLQDLLLDLIPELADTTFRSKPCMLTYTPKGYPVIDQLDEGLFVAAGGCGKSAKSSDMLGKLAALLITGKSWPEPFARSLFSVS